MTNEVLIGIVIGLVFGIIAMAILAKFMSINRKIKEIYAFLDAFPTPQEMATEILKVKMPISELPPEAMENVRNALDEKMENQEMTTEKSNYIG